MGEPEEDVLGNPEVEVLPLDLAVGLLGILTSRPVGSPWVQDGDPGIEPGEMIHRLSLPVPAVGNATGQEQGGLILDEVVMGSFNISSAGHNGLDQLMVNMMV